MADGGEDFAEDIPLPNSEAFTMASEATPPPETGEAEPEMRENLSTPTQDELPQLIGSLVPGVSASGLQAATSALSNIPLPTSTNPSDKTPPQTSGIQAGIDEISDSDFEEDKLANEALRPVEKSLDTIPLPDGDIPEDQRPRSRLSNVSSSENENTAVGKNKNRNQAENDHSDAVSLSGLSSGVF